MKSTFATGLGGPEGLVLDSAGNLYEADSTNGNILKFAPGGTSSIFSSALNVPAALALDGTGNLFAGDPGTNSIYKFTPGGAQSTFATGQLHPAFFTFSVAATSTPEPGTTAFLIGMSIASGGFFARRYRKSLQR